MMVSLSNFNIFHTDIEMNEQSVGISVGSHVRVTQVQIFCQMKNLLWGLYQVIDQMS